MLNLISYDLTKPHRDYETQFAAIKSYGTWCHLLESVWIVDTASSPEQIPECPTTHVDGDDKLFVVALQHNWGSWKLSKEITDWLKGRFKGARIRFHRYSTSPSSSSFFRFGLPCRRSACSSFSCFTTASCHDSECRARGQRQRVVLEPGERPAEGDATFRDTPG